jgi:hypothetical protein
MTFNSQGSVLDDPSLVEVLNANKRIATEVKEKVAIAEDTKIKIIVQLEKNIDLLQFEDHYLFSSVRNCSMY